MPLTKIKTLRDGGTGIRVTVNERLFVNRAGDALVEHGDPTAAFQFCSPGKRVLRSELERFGRTPGKPAGGKKRDKAGTEDKSDKGGSDNKGEAGIPGNVKTAKRTIAGAEDLAELAELDGLEAAREDGPRTGVTKALAKRRAELEA